MGEAERKLFVERVISIGFDVIQTQGQTSRVDFVKGEFDKMMTEFVTQFKDVFSESGAVSVLFDSYFGKTGDVTCLIDDHFGKDGKLATDIFNPSDSETPLGRFVTDLEALLDINNSDSAFYKIKECVEKEIGEMKTQIEQRDAVAKVESQGTVKGKKFETALFELVDVMARPFEDTVSFVGDEMGVEDKVGNILIQINPSNTKGIDKRIIIEAKKRDISLRGKESFLKELDKAMDNNLANYAIGAVHEENIPPSIGEYRNIQETRLSQKFQKTLIR